MKFIRRLLEKTPLVRFFRSNDRVAAIKSEVRVSRKNVRDAQYAIRRISAYGRDRRDLNFAALVLDAANEHLAKAEEL